ncbi:TIP41-like protein [Penicillium atrosanguineum]|nr:TIP41-like protein [Penicillium atrosanguineum]KAJ5122871.1 TIP41-like protein [Penicillium atrosanguineum]
MVASPGQHLRSASFSARGALSPYRRIAISSGSATWSSMYSTPSTVPKGHLAVSPEAKRPNEISTHGFRVSTQKQPILKADPIEDMTKKLGIAPPEMIFGDNYVMIEHHKSGWAINFNSFDALDLVDKTGQSMLQVAYSKEWQKSRESTHEGIKEVVKPFDWSYSTDYKGTLSPNAKPFEETTQPIPIELLKRPDPILFFDDVVLYEDELADNGIAMLSCKIRVMPGRMLLLSRFFMRLDNVLIRLRDTRVYVDFETREVIREYQSKECEYEKVRQMLAGTRDDIPALMRDPNRLSELLPIVAKHSERVVLDA